jgi:hypothetical protein
MNMLSLQCYIDQYITEIDMMHIEFINIQLVPSDFFTHSNDFFIL